MILLFVTLITISGSAEVNLSNATQSTTYKSDTADKAIDGDLTTSSNTNFEAPYWLRFDLEYSYVQKVVIERGFSYGNCTFTLSVFDNKGSIVCTGTYNKTRGYYNETINCGDTLASNVMLELLGCVQGLEINEIKVYGDSPCNPGQNRIDGNCTDCPPNTYSTNGTQCTQCSENKESSAGSISESNCTYSVGIMTQPVTDVGTHVEAAEGTDRSLTCVVYTPSSVPFHSIDWFKSDGTEITKDVTTFSDTPSSGQCTITLEFTPVTISDRAEYYCQIVYTDSTIGTIKSTTVTLDVYRVGIATTPDNLEIGDGINGSLSCVVYTPHIMPFTSIGWFTSDGMQISKGVTTISDTPSSGQATITLKFSPATISDRAEYYCQIIYNDSTIGTVKSATVKLDVYQKNFINSLPLTLTSEKFSSGIINVEKDDDVTLTCAVQGPLKKSVSLIVQDDEGTIIPQDPTPEVIIITDKVGEVTWTRKASCGDSIYKCRVNTTQYIKDDYLVVIVGSCGSASATVIIGGAVILIAAIIIIMLVVVVVLLLRKKSVVT